ncbi:pyridoxal phosphate-dependent aminotransferase [Leptolyngbya sp. NIES-2104]|uniref:pyridoxal phosphate-dependent aminotransferase n=1 Tax=Leptolyngbya sp. NIES-2104 TaxID=1552121 RepID=UPI0006EC7EBF|nr:pyridoxal phosphate-dependent aminotransferase [Leptolyngbya sp. NIES-2104]GAP95587.1 aspartate aminotransferase [Leptolyngbya sp. NIES-2104]
MNFNRLPARMQAVQSPIIPIVGELIRQHPGTISLGQGVVNYPPPQSAIDQITTFLSNPNHHKYQAVEGIPDLKNAIAHKLMIENKLDLSDREIVVTAGSNMAFLNVVLAITDPGDEIILQTPFYFNHEMAIEIASCRAVLVPTDENYQLQPNLIRAAITDRTRAIITISPNNPTGAVYSESALREVNQMCCDSNCFHITDEAYEYFTYGVDHFSAASIADSANHTISIFSLSKAYGFASWRIGYMMIPSFLLESVQKIQDTNVICPSVIAQFAAVGALEAGRSYCEEKLNAIAQVREIVLDELQTIRHLCTVPQTDGAFYFLLKVHTEMDTMELVKQLIQDHRVAVLPGFTFGLENGCYLRVGYGALEKETAIAGIQRLVTGLKTIVETR